MGHIIDKFVPYKQGHTHTPHTHTHTHTHTPHTHTHTHTHNVQWKGNRQTSV